MQHQPKPRPTSTIAKSAAITEQLQSRLLGNGRFFCGHSLMERAPGGYPTDGTATRSTAQCSWSRCEPEPVSVIVNWLMRSVLMAEFFNSRGVSA